MWWVVCGVVGGWVRVWWGGCASGVWWGRVALVMPFGPSRPPVAHPLSLAAADWGGGMRGLHLYGRAAAALLGADVLLISAGAGMSADSGLAVYKDIDKVTAWRKMGVTGVRSMGAERTVPGLRELIAARG